MPVQKQPLPVFWRMQGLWCRGPCYVVPFCFWCLLDPGIRRDDENKSAGMTKVVGIRQLSIAPIHFENGIITGNFSPAAMADNGNTLMWE